MTPSRPLGGLEKVIEYRPVPNGHGIELRRITASKEGPVEHIQVNFKRFSGFHKRHLCHCSIDFQVRKSSSTASTNHLKNASKFFDAFSSATNFSRRRGVFSSAPSE